MTVELYKTAKTLDAAIASIAERGKKLDADIHRTGCSVIAHALKHGDATPAARLHDALPKSGRRKAYVAWLEAFSPIKLTVENGKPTTAKLKKNHAPETYDVDGAIATPFWEFTVERKPVPMTLERALKAFEANLVKGIETGDIDLKAANDAKAAVAFLHKSA